MEMKTNTAMICIVGTILVCATGADRAWGAEQAGGAKPKTSQMSIAAKGVEEMCVKLTPPEKLRYDFTATGQLTFSVHYHVGNDVRFPIPEHLTASEKSSFAPTV